MWVCLFFGVVCWFLFLVWCVVCSFFFSWCGVWVCFCLGVVCGYVSSLVWCVVVLFPWCGVLGSLGGPRVSLGSRVLWKSENPKTQVHQQKPSPYYCLRLLFSPQSSSCRYVFFLSLSDGVAMLDFINFWPFVSHTDGHCFSFLRRFPVIPGIPTKTCK